MDVSETFTTSAWEDDLIESEDEDDSDSDCYTGYEANSISSSEPSALDIGSEFGSDEDQSSESEGASELESDSDSDTEGRFLPAFFPCQAEDWAADDAPQELDHHDLENVGSSPRYRVNKICDEETPQTRAIHLIGIEKVALLAFTREECEEILNRLGPKPKLKPLSGKSNQP